MDFFQGAAFPVRPRIQATPGKTKRSGFPSFVGTQGDDPLAKAAQPEGLDMCSQTGSGSLVSVQNIIPWSWKQGYV